MNKWNFEYILKNLQIILNFSQLLYWLGNWNLLIGSKLELVWNSCSTSFRMRIMIFSLLYCVCAWVYLKLIWAFHPISTTSNNLCAYIAWKSLHVEATICLRHVWNSIDLMIIALIPIMFCFFFFIIYLFWFPSDC